MTDEEASRLKSKLFWFKSPVPSGLEKTSFEKETVKTLLSSEIETAEILA